VPSIEIRDRQVSWRRLLAGGIILTALAGIAGGAWEIWRFGVGDAAAARRVESHINRRFEAMVQAISDVSARIATSSDAATALAPGSDARRLFDLVAEVRRTSASPDDIAVTVYDTGPFARAWAGAPSDTIPDDQISGPSTLLITPSPLGLRLVHVQPIVTSAGGWVGSVAAEHVLSPAQIGTTIAPVEYRMQTPLAPALLRIEGAADSARPGAVMLRAPTGRVLAEAWVDPADLRRARSTCRRYVTAAMLALLGATCLLLVGPLLDRRLAGDGRTYVRATLASLGFTAVAGLLLWLAVAAATGRLPSTPPTLLIAGGMAAGLVSLLAGPASRLRLAVRHRPVVRNGTLGSLGVQLVAGVAIAGLILLFQRLVEGVANPVSIDLRSFSLYPLTPTRLMLLGGLVALNLAVLWAATLTLIAASAPRRVPRHALKTQLLMLTAWVAPSVIMAAVASARGWSVAPLGFVLSALACGIGALLGPVVASRYRRATVVARIFALLLAFLVPTLLLHSSVDFFAERAIRQLIVTEYAVQAQNHVQTLRAGLDEAKEQVDTLEELPELVTARASVPTADAAFLVWKQTALARERLTSNVELYDEQGELVSRFALNVPDYTAATTQPASGCTWVTWAEVSPFGAEERRMLHAERGICSSDENGSVQRGTIILHVVFDFETLPFITSQNPYFEIFRSAELKNEDDAAAANVEVAIYGWGLQPLYTSGRSAWPITDELFARLYRSREPFWTAAGTGGVTHRVYFSNDRERIFAIGYPVLTWFDHFVHLAELTTFGGAAFVVALIGTAIFTRLARQRPRMGRALLREIRASFYRKLFLAFVLAAIVPVLTLALFIRAYFENLLRTDIEAEAARTAAVAQRVIEEGDATLRRSAETLGTQSDEFMVWIEQVIDQDVNVFNGARLVATSERDLFASGVLPTRTPDDVYRQIVLQRLPSFVRQDVLGGFTYILAAAPVRAAGEDALLTVPLALRQREIGREIDELDRGVHLAALFFVLLGAGIGLSMAERIADPVRRLTRATGRIARGDFDAHIAVRSADELRRLADSFNSMAAELKEQRVQLERTHRLEAWAEMARQVAHEIKNPLTPIQLSAEHLQRVHADQSKPMGPVLDNCVGTILGQVRLLRRIASEFSSFASSPTARPARVDLPELVAEVVNPYRTGLQGRVEIFNGVPNRLPQVYVDRTLFARALANIVENALHAMPGHGSLTITAAADQESVTLSISDTGVGMDEESLARVFEPYFSTKTTGTGLGLPIARRNIELIGGTIEVASTKGSGTTVTIRLPLASRASS
jgi:signal transduction histidine kinase